MGSWRGRAASGTWMAGAGVGGGEGIREYGDPWVVCQCRVLCVWARGLSAELIFGAVSLMKWERKRERELEKKHE